MLLTDGSLGDRTAHRARGAPSFMGTLAAGVLCAEKDGRVESVGEIARGGCGETREEGQGQNPEGLAPDQKGLEEDKKTSRNYTVFP